MINSFFQLAKDASLGRGNQYNFTEEDKMKETSGN
jgi:hypothetical protein